MTSFTFLFWASATARWLRSAAEWLAPLPAAQQGLFIPLLDPALLSRTRALTTMQDAFKDRDGETKRHQVYAKLIKEFPKVEKRTLALAIEVAIRP